MASGVVMGQASSTSTAACTEGVAAASMTTAATAAADLPDRIRGALYGLMIADAMAMPSHWFYGGQWQVNSAYGEIKTYVKPTVKLSGSIMSKSNTGGGGRGGYSGNIVGDVIFHGKKEFWARGADYHYHHALDAGDNTLEPLLLRRVLNVTAANQGKFNVQALTDDYITFMTTPNTHNDTYCGTCHRMYFSNWKAGMAPKDCPDNDNHNVDTSDSIITTVPVALMTTDEAETMSNVVEMVRITRKSKPSEQYAQIFSKMLRAVVFESLDSRTAAQQCAKSINYRLSTSGSDPVHA